MKAPYLREIFGNIWEVDGKFVRDEIDVEFTNGTHDLVSKYVPAGQIWIDRARVPADQDFWILRQRTEREGLMAGMSPDEAFYDAQRTEIDARARVALPKLKDPDVFVSTLATLRNGDRVDLVDGFKVRCRLYVDFTLGGNGRADDFVPPHRIWIDDAVIPEERTAVAFHETLEMRAMLELGVDYNEAHSVASDLESRFRSRKR